MARILFFRGPVVEGDPPLFVYRLRQTRTRIGRVDDCDVVLPDEEVSRSHLLLDPLEDAFFGTDRSSNGTWLNGERFQRGPIGHGDQLRIGPFTAVIDLHGEGSAPPTERAQPESRHEQIVDAGETLAVEAASLRITSGPGEGRRFRLRGGRIQVGGTGSKVALPDGSLVKDHVRIRLMHGRTMIEPGAGAAFLGPVRIRDIVPVQPGEEVRIGLTEFVVEWETTVDAPVADHFGEMVGSSEGMRRAFGVMRRIAAHHAPVLLTGESGTGKELAARAIHEASPRAGAAFVALNCGAITPTLFESELFGHEKGAFTGATERRDGAFQRADGGMLFLDEVGELPEEAQAKLLRVLESGEVRRVGGATASYPDARIVAATNRNLTDEVKAGRFRGDLYFRLAVLPVRLPPLRERPDDIPEIAGTIARRLHPDIRITPAAMARLQAFAWPGNARELRNVLTRAYVMMGPHIDAEALEFHVLDEGPRPAVSPRGTIEDTEREMIIEAMRKTEGNRSEAARILGIARSTLLYKLRRWGISD